MPASRGYFLTGSSWLHRRHPTTKLMALGVVLLAAFLLPPIVLLALALALGVVAWWCGLLRPTIVALRIPAVLITSILLINTFLYPGASEIVVRFGPFALSREGLAFGVISAVRLLVVFVASVLFLFTTLADDLLEALVGRGVGHRLAFVVLSAVQLIPGMQARAATILDAQQARGLDVSGSLRRRVGSLVPLVLPVLLGSLAEVRERTLALEARGFGARPGRTAYRTVVDPPEDRAVRWALVVIALAVVVVALVGIWR
jgi:energy-coupling factor transport system permease protein